MSYDISFRVKVEGLDEYVEVGCQSANITWNVGKIIRLSTGLEWKNEANNGLCIDVIPKIRKGLYELLENPQKFKPYESPNGYGTVEGTINFFEQVLREWYELQTDYETLVNVATFWVT